MYKRCIRRWLPVFIFTFFIILYVDFQLRTSSIPKLSAVQRPSPGASHRALQQPPNSHKDARNPAHNSGSSGSRHSATEGAHASQPKLKQDDIFIAVKTTGRFHQTRLALLLETWISRTKAHVSLCCVCAVMDRQQDNSPPEPEAVVVHAHLSLTGTDCFSQPEQTVSTCNAFIS